MKLTNFRIESALQVLLKIKNSGATIPAMPMFKLVRNIKNLSTIHEDYEAIRIDLIKKYGVEDATGALTVEQDKRPEFFAELNPVINTEIEVDIITLKIEDLANIEFSMDELLAIDFLIED